MYRNACPRPKSYKQYCKSLMKIARFSQTGHFDRIVFSKLRNYLLKIVLTQRKKTEEIAPCVQRIVKKRISKFRRVRKDS